MTAKTGDFHFNSENDKPVGKAQSEAEDAVRRLYNAVNSDRDSVRPKPLNPEVAANSPANAEPTAGDTTGFLSQKPALNYYEGKLSAGAGTAAETGLKGLFKVDRLNSMLSANNESTKPYSSTRVDGLSLKKDPTFTVPDFVPPFPSA